MTEENPLKISLTPAVSKENTNTKGRPRLNNCTKFSQPHKSIVSQLLSQMKHNNVKFPIMPVEISMPIDSIEDPSPIDDETDEFVYCKIPRLRRKKNKAKCKDPAEPKLFSCVFPNCSYTSNLSSNLHKHKRTHTHEKPYLCDRCSFRSNFSNSLKVHKRLHTTERPYQCLHCSYKCNSASNLKKHRQNKHNDKPNSVLLDSKDIPT